MKSPLPIDFFYFDYNATHPPIPEVITESNEEYLKHFYNPSGATRFSLGNQGKIETTRKYFAELAGVSQNRIVFSSSGTEANYLLVSALRSALPRQAFVIVSPFEHASMYSALQYFHFEMKIIGTDKTGLIDLASLKHLLEESPGPVICLSVGNETGVIQQTKEISEIAKSKGVLFLSDLMQGFGKISLDFQEYSGFTFSSHKIGGGMGCALTAVFDDSNNYSIFSGGNQENGHRAGTENLPAILAFQKASEFQLLHLSEKNKRLSFFKNQMEQELEKLGCEIIAKNSPRVPNTSFVKLPIDQIDFFMLGMEERGFMISTGSSCKSRAREASTSLLAMGYNAEEALSCIRISTGVYTTQSEIQALTQAIGDLLKTFSSNS
jgi:cysteine desulfurase